MFWYKIHIWKISRTFAMRHVRMSIVQYFLLLENSFKPRLFLHTVHPPFMVVRRDTDELYKVQNGISLSSLRWLPYFFWIVSLKVHLKITDYKWITEK